MTGILRVVSWNCRRATAASPAWDYLLGLEPDVALLQEVTAIPARVTDHYASVVERATGRRGGQRFGTAILVRGSVGRAVPLVGPLAWVDVELQRFAGNVVARVVKPEKSAEITVVSVYSPAWPIDRARLEGLDVSSVKLIQNPDVWVADLVWACLHQAAPARDDPWIVAGDFNASETFDLWRGGPRGNREYLDRMAALGLTECLRHAQGALTPTFRNPRGGVIAHQLDHLFITQILADQLIRCETGQREEVFGGGLSDHLPVIADFDVSDPETWR